MLLVPQISKPDSKVCAASRHFDSNMSLAEQKALGQVLLGEDRPKPGPRKRPSKKSFPECVRFFPV